METKRTPKWMLKTQIRKPKVDYVMFCDVCFIPKKLSKHILTMYVVRNKTAHIYCNNCSNKQQLPKHIVSIMDDILNSI